MIGTSRLEYIFIRFCIVGLHYLAPLCLLYCGLVIAPHGIKTVFTSPLPLIIESIALAESLFFLCVYLPYRYHLQREAIHPPAPSRQERKEIFELCNKNIADYEQKGECKGINFLRELNSIPGIDSTDPEEQIGIIAIEIMPVSFRITHSALSRTEMCEEINQILIKEFGPDQKFVLASHSYGTVVTTHLLKDPTIAQRIGPVVLIDPVSILLHLPDVAYNFTRRKPKQANEHQLYYFASMDMGVSHTLSRHFFWNENVLWKQDLGKRNVTVPLSGRDLIVDNEAVGRYLASGPEERCQSSSESGSGTLVDITPSPPNEETVDKSLGLRGGEGGRDRDFDVEEEEWTLRPWRGEGIDILWFRDLDHAHVFDGPAARGRLVGAIREYCESGSDDGV